MSSPIPSRPSARFLGTGWSHGVPMIGCNCEVCTTRHPRNIRRRPALQLQHHDLSIIIDTGPDFRDQVLTFGIHRVDAVFFTHEHSDHVMGFDDVRRFTWHRDTPMPVYAAPPTLTRLQSVYSYVSPVRVPGKAVPKVAFLPWSTPVTLGPFRLQPFEVPHGDLPCRGIRIETDTHTLGYVPDCADLPPDSLAHLRGVDTMVLNALRHAPHPAHLTLERSLELLHQIGAPQSFLTHMGCDFDYPTLNPALPHGISMAYDGLEILL